MAAPQALAKEIVDAINDLAGRHEGHRAVHAKGTLLAGTLTATPEGAALTRAAHLQGDPTRVTARFSNGGGNPGAPDHGQDGRGLAVKAYLPDGSTSDFVTVNLPCFFVRTAEDFLAFTRARVPDPDTGQPDMEKLGKFFEAHPEAMPAIQAALLPERPESYASVRYNGIHAFRWTAGDGELALGPVGAGSPRPARPRSPRRTRRSAATTTCWRRSSSGPPQTAWRSASS